MSSGPRTYVFVDESSRTVGKKSYQGYYLAASIVATSDMATARRALTEALPAGRSSMHFTKEETSDRKRFLDAIASVEISTRIYVHPNPKDSQARPELLADLVADLDVLRASHLALEQRAEHQNRVDRRIIGQQAPATLQSYDHAPATEPLLWVPDAVAWCYGHPDWRPLVMSLGLIEVVKKR